MKLYYFETPNPRKACAVARHLSSPVELVRVDLAKGDHQSSQFLAINPNGKVPALVDGELRLWEATAIMVHLARKAGSEMWPDDQRQVEVVRWLSWDAHHFSRHGGTLYFEHVIKRWVGGGDPDAATVAEATGHLQRFARILDDHLEGRDWLVGHAPTLADFAVGNLLPYAEAKLPLDPFARIRRWHDRLNELPAWREPFPAAPGA